MIKKLLLILFLFAPSAIAQTTSTFIESGTDATQDVTGFYTVTAGTVTSATDQFHTGTHALKASTGNPAVTGGVRTTAAGVVTDAGSQISFWFRMGKVPTTALASTVIITQSPTLNTVYTLAISTAGVLTSTPIGATAVTGSTLAINTWYRICISYYITNTTTFQFKVYVNGVLDSTANAGTMTRATSSVVRFLAQDNYGINANNWWDDIYMATGGASSSSQPDTGDIRVTAKLPKENGTSNQFTTQIGAGPAPNGLSGSTGHATNVSELPLSLTYGWSTINAGSIQTEEYNIQGASVGEVSVTGKTLVDYLGWVNASSVLSESASIMLAGSSSGTIALTSTPTMFFKLAGSTTYPAGTGTDIGIVSDNTVTTVGLYETGIVVAYLNGASCGKTMTLMGAGGC